MQQVAVADVKDDGAAIPADVLRALGVSAGDRVAFVANDDGTISIVKAALREPKRSVGAFAGIFATGQNHSLEGDLAPLREIRYGDECDEREAL